MKKTAVISAVLLIAVAAWFTYESRPAATTRRVAAGLLQSTRVQPWSINEQAIPVLQEKLKRDESSPEWNAALGNAYLQKARESGDPSYYTKAEELFDRALKKNPDYVDALIGSASLAMSRHEFSVAKEIADRAAQIAPYSAMTFGMLADALTELGRYDDAVKALDQMVRLKPNLSSYSRISYMRELHGDTSGAETAMEMAIQAGAPNAENTAWCIVQLGNLYLGSGRVNEAESAYQAALARFPKYVHAYAGLAKAFVAKEQFGDAEMYYKKAIEQVPMPEFLIGLGELYERLGRGEDAQAQYGLVRAIQQIYRENGVQMDGEMALFNADRNFESDQALVVAEREWQKRNSIKTADIYAWTLYRNGRHKEAGNIMSQALRLGTRDPLLYYHAGMISYAMKKPDEAVNYLSTALGLNSGFSPVHAEHARQTLKLLETEEKFVNVR